MQQCEIHNEEYKYNPFGYFCISCYNENLIKLRNEGDLNEYKRGNFRAIRQKKD